jgi:MFS superfamily sulfate permease-like transporter
MMAQQWIFAVAAMALAFLLLNSRRLPAMPVLLALGITTSFLMDPGLLGQVAGIPIGFTLPDVSFNRITWQQFAAGAFLLGLPQLPLTWGNAVLGTVAENNSVFPDKPITVKKVAVDHGLINAVSYGLGGIPVCHGAGGMAGHVRFGARTGGALVMLGVMLLVLGLFFSRSVALIFQLIPPAVLGAVLFVTGLELASTAKDVDRNKEDIYVLLLTAAIAIVNVGIAFVAGLAFYHAMRRRIVRV